MMEKRSDLLMSILFVVYGVLTGLSMMGVVFRVVRGEPLEGTGMLPVVPALFTVMIEIARSRLEAVKREQAKEEEQCENDKHS